MRQTCSIVIRCYNEEQHIGRLLEGIIQQTVKDVEVILVDSGSTDATVAIAQSIYPIKLISLKPEEFSFGRALNIGCQAASNDLIVIASAHVYPVYQDWLENLLTPFENTDIALVYGKQEGNEVSKYSEQQVFAQWFPERSSWQQLHPFSNNANAAIRRSLWEKLPYDEELTGLEDLDWAKKAQKLGYQIAYNADAVIVHVHDEPPNRIYNRYRREAIALKNICPEENFYIWDFIRLFSSNLISDYYHAWHDRLLWRNLQEIFIFRLMQFWGTYQGFRQHGKVSSELKKTFYYPKPLKRSQDKRNNTSERLINYADLKTKQERQLEHHY